jgi:hypothetical protein
MSDNDNNRYEEQDISAPMPAGDMSRHALLLVEEASISEMPVPSSKP